jgi:hypothetical protein
MNGAGAGSEEAAWAQDDPTLKSLSVLVYHKNLRISPDVLSKCAALIRQTERLRINFPDRQPAIILEAVLEEVFEREREQSKSNGYLRAAGEFIGLRDEQIPDPPVPSYEHATEFETRMRRGGYVLQRRVTTSKSAKDHLPKALRQLLLAVDRFIARDDTVNLVRARLTGSNVESERGAIAPGSQAEPAIISLAATSSPPGLLDAPAGYVRRQREESEFYRLVSNGAKIIIFVGLPGMGKSWLARTLTAGWPQVRVISGLIDESDLASALEMCGTAAPWDRSSRVGLARLMCGEHAPQFILLDNLETANQLSLILPTTGCKSVIVATCRHKSDIRRNNWQYIAVDAMDDSEASQLAEFWLPELSKRDTTYLARSLGAYPIAIPLACALFAAGDVSLQEFCRLLRENIHFLAQETAMEDQGATLLVVLRSIVVMIKQQNRYAYELLRCLSLLQGMPFAYRKFLAVYLEKFVQLRVAGSPNAISFARAVSLLVEYSIIQIEDRRIEGGTLVRIHPFVQDLLKVEFFADRQEIARPLTEALHSFTWDSRRAWSGASDELRRELEYTYGFILHHFVATIPYVLSGRYNSALLALGQASPDSHSPDEIMAGRLAWARRMGDVFLAEDDVEISKLVANPETLKEHDIDEGAWHNLMVRLALLLGL